MTMDTTTDRATLAKALADARARQDGEGPAARRRLEKAKRDEQTVAAECRKVTTAAAVEVTAARSFGLQLDARVAELEHALRRSCDPKIPSMRGALIAFWDALRVNGAQQDALAALPKVKRAQAELEALELAVGVAVDGELRAILDRAGVTIRELELASHPWG